METEVVSNLAMKGSSKVQVINSSNWEVKMLALAKAVLEPSGLFLASHLDLSGYFKNSSDCMSI